MSEKTPEELRSDLSLLVRTTLSLRPLREREREIALTERWERGETDGPWRHRERDTHGGHCQAAYLCQVATKKTNAIYITRIYSSVLYFIFSSIINSCSISLLVHAPQSSVLSVMLCDGQF